MNIRVEHDEAAHRFVCEVEGHVGRLTYHRTDEAINFTSTYVPPPIRNQKVAEALVKEGIRYAKEQGLEVIATCAYVADYVRRHPV